MASLASRYRFQRSFQLLRRTGSEPFVPKCAKADDDLFRLEKFPIETAFGVVACRLFHLSGVTSSLGR